ncbi:anthranilate synthase component II [Aegicerativicinus sediminis]
MKRILVIDNYDSFTYNLVHYLEDLECEVTVKRNDQLEMHEPEEYDRIVLSPGPGIPDEAGLLKPIIERYGPTKPILGVCLGQQAIGEVYGGNLINLSKVFHGVSTEVQLTVDDDPMFTGLGSEFQIGRYHSWVIDQNTFPEVLEVTSIDKQGQIMSIRHKFYNIRGVQYHPESVLTPNGKQILENWLKLC